MIRKIALTLPLLAVLAVYLLAADFWESKPYTEWDDKEIQKIFDDSPWGTRSTSAPDSRASSPRTKPRGTLWARLKSPCGSSGSPLFR